MTLPRRIVLVALAAFVCSACGEGSESFDFARAPTASNPSSSLQVGVAAVRLTPCGANPEWDGPVTASGVWGETFTDTNGNGRWDTGEPFEDDPVNTALDSGSKDKYDGIFLAGFDNDRIATGCHDDLWARVLVLKTASHKVALVTVDFVGELMHGTYYGFARARDMVDSSTALDTIIFSSTHDHEAPDTLGLWGTSQFVDGKFPRYLQFVDRQVARAINTAAAPTALRPASVVAARTTPITSPELQGLQVRTHCRPPFFFDEELRALQFIGSDGRTIATLINWNTHPESLEGDNTEVSSDFIGYIRDRVESALGGTAVYLTGDLGAVEIVGDSCVGGADPHAADGSNEFDTRADLGFARTQKLGQLVGDATVAALRQGEPLALSDVDVTSKQYFVRGSNPAFKLANSLGVLDLDMVAFDPANCPVGSSLCAPVEQDLLTFHDAAGQPLVQLLTAPGELFPELYYGVAQHHRTDCPAADTGQPFEPSIRDAMSARYRLLIGLSPDEFGYIVPGYDFRAPPNVFSETPDACDGQPIDGNPHRLVPTHYHETNSLGIDIAATTTCYALELLGHTSEVSSNAACQRSLPLP